MKYDCNEPREYTDRIDFTRTCHNWPVRGEIHVYIPAAKIPAFVSTMLREGVLESFGVKVGIVCTPSSVSVQLCCRSAIGDKVDAALTAALTAIQRMGYTIYWSEGDFSYKIDSSGRIIDKIQIEGGG